jgi:hypothetical protein
MNACAGGTALGLATADTALGTARGGQWRSGLRATRGGGRSGELAEPSGKRPFLGLIVAGFADRLLWA